MTEVARRKFAEVAGYLVGLGAETAGELALVEQSATVYARWAATEAQLSQGDPGWRTVLTRQGTPGDLVPNPRLS